MDSLSVTTSALAAISCLRRADFGTIYDVFSA